MAIDSFDVYSDILIRKTHLGSEDLKNIFYLLQIITKKKKQSFQKIL